MKRAIVLGAGGFIGSHLVKKLVKDGYWVRGVDLKYPEFSETTAQEFFISDLRDEASVKKAIPELVDEVYQLAADVGGAGYLFTGENDAAVMHNSAAINLNVAKASVGGKVKKLFYASSACIYPKHNQLDPLTPQCSEESAYPANPDSEYGWEKLFSERLFQSYARNHNLNIRIARFHNIFGPECTWAGGREKAPAAICRKVAEAAGGSNIEIWGDGQQTRSFLYIDECIEGILKLMNSDFAGPVNIGSEEMIAVNKLAEMIIRLSGKNLVVKNVSGPQGVRGRTSDNKLISEKLSWTPTMPLQEGMEKTYAWIHEQVKSK